MQNSNSTEFLASQQRCAASNMARYQRDAARLTLAAWGVGGTHAYFRALPRAKQEAKVLEWTQAAMEDAEFRRSAMAQTV